MAEEVILSVSLKDYKQKIDELRASLLSLENTSEEYKKVAEEIKERQGKLNEVMSVGKQSVNAVAGSYNALSQELSALKKEWKNMEIGTKEWEDTAKQIDKLNDKLKDADAKVGVFGRNVGNYSQSFVQAFSMVGGSAGKMGSAVAAGAKSANVALKALAANPIGAAIAAVAMVINGLVKAFKRNEEATNNLKKAMVPFQVVLTGVQKVFDLLATSIGAAAEAVGNFFGKLFGNDSKMAQTQKELQAIADGEAQLAKQQRETIVKNADAENEVAELRYKAAQKSKYTEEERLGFLTQAGEKEKEIAQRAYEDLKLQYEIIKKKNALTESSAEDKQKEAEAYAAMVQAETAYFNKTKEIESQISELRNKDLSQVKELQKKLKEAAQNEIQNLTDKYKKEKKLLEKYGKDTKALTEQYEKDITKVKAKEWQERLRQEQVYQDIYLSQFVAGSSDYYEAQLQGLDEDYRLIKEKQKEIEERVGKEKPKTQADEDKIYSLFGYGSKADFDKSINNVVNAIAGARDNYKNALQKEFSTKLELKLIDVEGEAQKLKISFEEYLNYYKNLQKLSSESEEDFALRKKQWLKETEGILASVYMTASEQNKIIKDRAEAFYNLATYAEGMPHSVLEDIFSFPAGAQEALEKNFEDAEKQFNEFGDFIRDYRTEKTITYALSIGVDLTQLDRNSEEFKNAIEKFKSTLSEEELSNLDLLPEEMLNKQLENLQNYVDAEKMLLNQRKQNWMELANGIGDLMGSIADYYEADIDAQVQNGEMSEKQAKEEYKKVQALKISQAVIQTISGAIAAFMGCQELGQPWGLILGGVQAAAVTAAGMAQIAQIKKQNPYSTSTSVSSPAAVTPQLNEYSPERVSNITSVSDEQNLQEVLGNTNIWVSVEDINSAQNKSQVRVAESSF